MSKEPSANPVLGFLNSFYGKTVVLVTFITTVFTAVKLLAGDTRLAVTVVLITGAATLWVSSCYLFFRRAEIRESTVLSGVRITKPYAYRSSVRYTALAAMIAVPILSTATALYSKATLHGTRVTILDMLFGERISIGGYVVTAGGEPAGDAVVTLHLKGENKTTVATGGKFSFDRIDISKEPLRTLTAEIQWRDIKSSDTVDLSQGSRTDLRILLPAGAPPFKVEYYKVGGIALNFLVTGQVDKKWESKLAGQPFIAVNNVFKTFTTVLRDFSQEYEPGEGDSIMGYSLINGKKNVVAEDAPAKKYQKKPLLNPAGMRAGLEMSKADLLSAFDPAQNWHLLLQAHDQYPKFDQLQFFFWRFGDANDLKIALPPKNLYALVTKNYFPPDFLIVCLANGCGSLSNFLGLRTLQLRVAILENISERPIRIGKFMVRETDPGRLRSREEDQSGQIGSTTSEQVLFPQEYLMPKEHFLIPIELLLAYDTDDPSFAPKEFMNKVSGETIKELAKLANVSFDVLVSEYKSAPVAVNTSDLVKMLGRPTGNPELNKEFIYGPSLGIESVSVDGVNYPFRPLDTGVLVLQMEGGVGSCPYVYSYSSHQASWIDEGVFLYGRNAKFKESTEEKLLRGFEGRLLIREKDPEVSFIDSMYVKAIGLDGSQRLFYPKDNALRFEDGRYLILHQGDRMVIDFEIPDHLSATKYFLVTKGYYLPN